MSEPEGQWPLMTDYQVTGISPKLTFRDYANILLNPFYGKEKIAVLFPYAFVPGTIALALNGNSLAAFFAVAATVCFTRRLKENLPEGNRVQKIASIIHNLDDVGYGLALTALGFAEAKHPVITEAFKNPAAAAEVMRWAGAAYAVLGLLFSGTDTASRAFAERLRQRRKPLDFSP